MLHLLAVEHRFLTGRLPLAQGIVHLRTGIQQGLLELQQSFFLLCLADFQIRHKLPPLKKRLHQRAYRLKQPGTRISHKGSPTVGPSGRAAQCHTRIKTGACLIGGIKSLFKYSLSLPHIRTVGQQIQGHSHRQTFRKVHFTECAARNRLRSPEKEGTQRVFRFRHLLFQIQQRSFSVQTGSFCLIHGRTVGLSGPHQGLQTTYILLPAFYRFRSYGYLLVEHQQRVITLGHRGNKLCLHHLTIRLTLLQCRTLSPFGIGQFSKKIQFPAGRRSQRIGLGGFAAVKTAQSAFRVQLSRRQVSLLGS